MNLWKLSLFCRVAVVSKLLGNGYVQRVWRPICSHAKRLAMEMRMPSLQPEHNVVGPFPTPNLSTAKRSAPTIQSAKGADPKEQIQIQSHPPDSHHKAVPLVMPHTNGLLPDPEILVLNISGSAEMIFCFEHFGLCIPGTEFSVHLPVIQYQTFRASGCFGANGHAQS